MSDPVGMSEIAQRTGVLLRTVMQWRDRYRQAACAPWPQPRWTVGGRPAWDWSLDIEPWLAATGRGVGPERVWTLEADVPVGMLQALVSAQGGPGYGVRGGRYASVSALGRWAPDWMRRVGRELDRRGIHHAID